MVCGTVLACASMAVADWTMIWLRVKVVVSAAKSTSRISDSADCVLCIWLSRLLIACSRRFTYAPMLLRMALMEPIAMSMDAMERPGDACVVIAELLIWIAPVEVPTRDMDSVLVALLLGPMCRTLEAELRPPKESVVPVSSVWLLYWVTLVTRSISLMSAWYSWLV